MAFHRWLYRTGRPNRLAKFLNRGWAFVHAAGVAPNYLVTLEVVGRQSGKSIRFPLAMIEVKGERYLVSMLGAEANWVHNVQAAGGQARLHHGRTEEVHLTEIEASQRAPILKSYLRAAPGARPHIPVSKDAPLAEFAQIAARYPVYRVETCK